jgi:hypothetical protein
MHLAVNVGGIPHLAKNERDMGHPSFVRELEVPVGNRGRPSLVHPAAVASEIARRGSLPGSAHSLDREDSAAPAEMTAAFDYRHQCAGVCVIKSWYAQQSHISDSLVVLLGKFTVREQPIALRDGKLLLPSMSLPVGRDKGVGHLLLLRH